jgi:hypothetical protein
MGFSRDSRAAAPLVLGAALAAATACRGTLSTPDTGRDDAGSNASFHESPGDDASTPSLSVRASASIPAVCAGECVELTANVSGGRPPYRVSWDHDLPGNAATALVCPSMTTTYGVVASDSSGTAGEFARASAQGTASVTVTVDPSCSGSSSGDAGPTSGDTGETGFPPGAPPSFGLGHAACSVAWPIGGYAGNVPIGFGGRFTIGNVITDAAGDIFVVASHTGTAIVGGTRYPATGNDTGALVMELDAGCRLLWVRELGGYFANVLADSIAVDDSSNVIIGGGLSGRVDFGGVTASAPSPNAAFVLKLDPKGNAVWLKTFPSTADQGSAVTDLAVAPGGDVLLLASGGPDMDFGGGPVGGTSNDASFVVRLKPGGDLVFAKAPSSFGSGGALDFWRLATNRSGSVWLAATGADATGTMTTVPVLELDGVGAPVYTRWIEAPAGAAYWNGSAIKVDDANHVAEFTGWGLDDLDAGVGYGSTLRMLTQLSASGTPISTSTARYLSDYVFSWDGSHFLGMSPDGLAYVGSAFTGSLDLGALGTLATANQSIDVTVLDSAGHLRGAVQWDDGSDEIPTDLTVDAQGNAVVVGTEYKASTLSLFVAKLGW